MFRKIIALVLCASTLAFSLASCTPVKKEVKNDEKIVEITPEEPITVTDGAGRTVTLEKPAEKIVSVYYISTALLVALGCEDNLAGIEMKADTRELYKLAAPGLTELPAVGSGKGINIESIAALEPDLVVIPKKLADSAASLEEIGITVAVVDPETEENFMKSVEMLGKLCGKTEKADELISYYNTKNEEMRNLTAGLEKPGVYLCSASSYFSTCTDGMYQTKLIETAGGISVSAEIEDTYWQTVTPEQLVLWNPEYIFAVADAGYSLDDIYADEAIAETDAVKNGNVYTFPSDIEAWDYPTASSVLGVMWLTNKLHPEVYSEEQYISEAKEFYKTFFDIDVTDALLGVTEADAE